MDAEDNLKATMDDDEVTVASGSRTAGNRKEEDEFMVRFQLPTRPNAAHSKLMMYEVLAAILQAFPDDVVHIDNKQEEFVWDLQQTDEAQRARVKQASMTVHEVPSKNKGQNGSRWIIVLKFRSTTHYRNWKKNEIVSTVLRKHRVFMAHHQFSQNEWEIIGLGFLLGIHVVQFPQDAAKAHIEKLIQYSEPNHPEFALAPAKIQIRGKPTYTRAYEVTCPRKDGQKLYHLLTHGKFREENNRVFIPYSLKRTKASTFTSFLKENNQMLSDSYVMKIQGIPTEGIRFLESKFMQLSGVRYVVPTSKTQSHGEWRILIK